MLRLRSETCVKCLYCVLLCLLLCGVKRGGREWITVPLGTFLFFRPTVCNNHEKHLRGNTYIEYENLRSAVVAYRALHSRWYGGKQLSLQFCQIMSWKNAICGLQSRQRCPKGRACNFLHVFRNPARLFTDERRETSRQDRISVRSWRWSESPERTPSRRHVENDRKKRESRHRRHSHRSQSKSRRNR